MISRCGAALLAALVVVSGIAHADPASTHCSFGGPTPTWQVDRLDLPEGSSFLTLELAGPRAQRGLNGQQNWHLSEGILVLNADTLALEAYRIASKGMAPRQVVAGAGGASAVEGVQAPEVPFTH